MKFIYEILLSIHFIIHSMTPFYKESYNFILNKIIIDDGILNGSYFNYSYILNSSDNLRNYINSSKGPYKINKVMIATMFLIIIILLTK